MFTGQKPIFAKAADLAYFFPHAESGILLSTRTCYREAKRLIAKVLTDAVRCFERESRRDSSRHNSISLL
jgi:hypothetical protein